MCSNWSPIYKSHLQERGFYQIEKFRTHRIDKDTPGMVGADGWRRRLAGTSQSGPDPWRGNTWIKRHLDQEHLVVVRQETPVWTSTCAWTGAIWELVNFAAAGILEEAWSWVQVKSVKLGWQAFWKVCLEQQLPGNNCKNSQTVHKKLSTIVTTFVTREERSETLLSEKKGAQPQKNASVTVRLKMCRERGFRREIEGFETKILGLEKIVSCHSG